MRFRCLSLFLFALVATPSVFALDATCEMVLKASEARIDQPAWHSITETGGMRMEAIKANGQFYRRTSEKWTKFPVNIDDTERKLLTQIRSGELKMTQCKVVGSDSVDGIPVTVVSSRTELKGAPPGDAKLYIGKLDGLPYRQTGEKFTVVYRYKGVVAPKL